MGRNPRDLMNYISSRSLKRLRRLMFANNIKFGINFNYFDIQKQGGKWYAFYYKPLDERDDFFNELKGK